MTSTNYNIGLGNRNSSRVLKPPGGGGSDIFGVSDNQETPFRIVKQTQNKSSIGECFTQDNSAQVIKSTVKHEVVKTEKHEIEKFETVKFESENIQTENIGVEKIEASSENGVNGKSVDEKECKAPLQATPQRVRVPPGGFSSAFW